MFHILRQVCLFVVEVRWCCECMHPCFCIDASAGARESIACVISDDSTIEGQDDRAIGPQVRAGVVAQCAASFVLRGVGDQTNRVESHGRSSPRGSSAVRG